MEENGKEREGGCWGSGAGTEEELHLWGQAKQFIWCGDAILSLIAVNPGCLVGLVLRALGCVCLRKSEGIGVGWWGEGG